MAARPGCGRHVRAGFAATHADGRCRNRAGTAIARGRLGRRRGGAILALFLFVALALSLPAAAMEDIGPMEAIRRGWSLGRKRRLALLGNAVGFVIVLALLSVLISLTIGLLAAGLGLASREIAGIVTSALAVLAYFSLAVLGGSAASFLPAFLYFEARMQTDGWTPPWRVAPHPDWPTATGTDEQAFSRRGVAWRDFLLVNLAALGLLAALAWLAPKPEPGAAAPSSSIPGNHGIKGIMQPAKPNRDETAGEHPGGPFTLHMGAFFKSDQDPSFWLDVETSARPSGEASLRILSVTDEQGRDIHAADNTFERNPFFATLRWSRAPDGNGVVAHRTVHLLPGAGQSDIALIRGELVLAGQRLPFTLRPDARARLIPPGAKAGKRQTNAGLGEQIEEMDEGELNQKAYAAYQNKDYDRAIAYLTRALEINPNSGWAWYTRSWAYWETGRKKQAYADMDRACSLHYRDACSLKNN